MNTTEKCDACHSDNRQVYCRTCEESICLYCNRTRHFSTHTDHVYNMMCEECENDIRCVHCDMCEQSFCSTCDQTIHRKGTRAQHKRQPLSREEDFKMILNFVYIPGNITDQDMKYISGYMVDKGLMWMKQHTVISYHGERCSKLNEFIQTTGFMVEQVSKMHPSVIVDYFVKRFDKSVFLNEVIVLSKYQVPDEVRRIFEELYPSSTMKSMIVTVQSDKDLSREMTEELRSIHYKSDVGLKTIQSYSLKGGVVKGDSKDPTNDNIIDTLNSGSNSILKKHTSSSYTASRVEPKTFSLVNSNQLLSRILSCKTLAELNSINSTTQDYLEVYFGLRELRHAPAKLKSLLMNSSLKVPRPLPLDHLFNDINVDPMLSANTSLKVQDILKKYAEDGDILVDYNHILNDIVHNGIATEDDAKNLLLRMADLSIIIINCRQVTLNHSLNLVSLKLEVLSLENLYWVVKSLTIDKLTPTEDIVAARIKEAYGVKFKPKIWTKVIDSYASVLKNSPKSVSGDGKVSESPSIPEYFNLSIDHTESMGLHTIIFTILTLGIPAEDVNEISDDDDDWIFFKQYINILFDEGREELLFYNNISTNVEVKKANNHLDKPIYNQEECSSSNFIINSSVTENAESSKPNPNSSVTEHSKVQVPPFKAISGGRYGMAQFLKYFGPERYKRLSIGRLSRLVQKAIDGNMLVYYKTYVLKKSDIEKEGERETRRRSRSHREETNLVSKFKEVLVDYLIESNNCLPLAQLSDMISKKLDFKFDFREYGFEKLTQFIESNCILY